MNPESWSAAQRKEAEKAVDLLSRYANNVSMNSSYFVNAVMQEHRTLQQAMFSLFMSCIREWARLSENHYDLRNEFTVETSKKIMKAIGEFYGAPLV